jgi:uncharacterized protein (TIGR03000 family)
MLRKRMTLFVGPALVGAALLLCAGPSSAAVYFGVGPGGFTAGYPSGQYVGYYNSYPAYGWYRSAYASYYAYPEYYANYYSVVPSYAYGYVRPTYYSMYAPEAARYYRPPNYVARGYVTPTPTPSTLTYLTVPENTITVPDSTTTTVTAAYPAALAIAQARGDRALVDVHFPANAEVWFEGVKMTQSGNDRLFESPPLTAGHSYSYHIRVRWMGNNGPIDETKEVRVGAGTRATVEFDRP